MILLSNIIFIIYWERYSHVMKLYDYIRYVWIKFDLNINYSERIFLAGWQIHLPQMNLIIRN